MARPIGPMDEETQHLLEQMAASKKNLYKVLAKQIGKPKRIRPRVNVNKLNKLGKSNETLVIPGKVLATGDVTKPLKVYALLFSAVAKSKIEKAGGSCGSLQELVQKQETGRIIL